MELRYKTSLEELVEGILLISCRSPLRFIFCYIIVGTLFPLFLLYVFIYTIYYLYFYPTPSYLVEELVEQLILCVTELSLWGVAVGFRKPMMKWCTKRAVFNRIIKKKGCKYYFIDIFFKQPLRKNSRKKQLYYC